MSFSGIKLYGWTMSAGDVSIKNLSDQVQCLSSGVTRSTGKIPSNLENYAKNILCGTGEGMG